MLAILCPTFLLILLRLRLVLDLVKIKIGYSLRPTEISLIISTKIDVLSIDSVDLELSLFVGLILRRRPSRLFPLSLLLLKHPSKRGVFPLRPLTVPRARKKLGTGLSVARRLTLFKTAPLQLRLRSRRLRLGAVVLYFFYQISCKKGLYWCSAFVS
jgi:hypothetical protein